jgi:hypothetical protein
MITLALESIITIQKWVIIFTRSILWNIKNVI